MFEFAVVNFIGRVNARVTAARKAFDAKHEDDIGLGSEALRGKKRTAAILSAGGKMAWLLLRWGCQQVERS